MAGLETLALIGTVVSAAGSVASGISQSRNIKAAGRAQQQEAQFRAEQGRVNAGQQRASAQRAAIEDRRRGRLAQSRAISLGAAGGGSTEDIVGTLGGLGAFSEYNALSSLFEGEESARQLEAGADLALFEGDNAMRAANARASAARTSGFVKAGTTLFSKYADGGFAGLNGGDFDPSVSAPPKKPF